MNREKMNFFNVTVMLVVFTTIASMSINFEGSWIIRIVDAVGFYYCVKLVKQVYSDYFGKSTKINIPKNAMLLMLNKRNGVMFAAGYNCFSSTPDWARQNGAGDVLNSMVIGFNDEKYQPLMESVYKEIRDDVDLKTLKVPPFFAK